MESIHGVDVSWLHNTQKQRSRGASVNANAPSLPKADLPSAKPEEKTVDPTTSLQPPAEATNGTQPRQIPARPGFTRSSGSADKLSPVNSRGPAASPSTGRRNSWLSSISSKFGSSPGSPSPASIEKPAASPVTHDARPPLGNPYRGAVLPPAQKPDGDSPYIPAPVKTSQHGFLQSALRRLSSSSGAQYDRAGIKGQHGMCERQVLNIDQHRERCRCPELQLSRLRRVAFCVDVEIASGPRYVDEEVEDDSKKDKKQRKKIVEKGEGDALKNPQQVKEDKENSGVMRSTGEELPKEPKLEATDSRKTPSVEVSPVPNPANGAVSRTENGEKDTTKKKEKKKRSEEERKARKEKKRKQAEANGTVPVELVRNPSESSLETLPASGLGTPRTQASPTTDPARIYRRCCQLRETPILKKITEQLTSPVNSDSSGVVTKLDLSGYWMQLPDLITLGDYLAVVPIKDLIMEGCGLTDEGVRVILAGLLAAKLPDNSFRRRHKSDKPADVPYQGGVVQRLSLKNNPNIGKEGWKHVSLFIHMCKTIKSIDLSMNTFPQPPALPSGPPNLSRTTTNSTVPVEISQILSSALENRLAGSNLELINIAETGITTEQLGLIIDGAIKSGLCRLGIAGNNITAEGMAHVVRFVQAGRCEGLDLGGNDLRDNLDMLADVIEADHPLWALSLSNCDITPQSLDKLFPVLAQLKNFRFIDLSHNHELFSSRPSAMQLMRKHLPTMPLLKRIHLTDVSLSPEQAVALAEILPEVPSLAHVNILGNPQLSALANGIDEANQEEACALFASLMAAVRVSKTLVCIDIDVPVPESSEVVKALAKQVVAYCLRNMERGPVAEIAEAVATITDPHGGEKEVTVPDVLFHLVGHVEGSHENHDDDDPAPDEDYVIGGTGVVKALGICLRNSGSDSRRPSADRSHSESGSPVPKANVNGAKAKDMSKNLLGSARKIRARLQPAIIKEQQSNSLDRDREAYASYQRLLFLDQTLENMIKRFEDEYPETRLPSATAAPVLDPADASPTETSILAGSDPASSEQASANGPCEPTSDTEDSLRPPLSRHNSDVSLASRALSQEEGIMHRFGQQFRRDILKPETVDHLHGTTGKEVWAPHLQMLRATIEELGGDEIRRKVQEGGQEAVLKELCEEASVLRDRIIESDPEGWERFVEAQEIAKRNSVVQGMEQGRLGAVGDGDGSAIE